MRKQIRILTVIDQYFPMKGGAENIARFIVENTNDNEFINNVLTIASKQITKLAGHLLSSQDVIDGKYTIYRFRYARLRGKEKNGFLFRYVTVLKYVLHLARLRNKYDVIHAHSYYWPAFASVIAGKILSKPVIITGHNRLYRLIDEIRDGYYPSFTIKILRFAQRYIAISRGIEKEAHLCAKINSSNIKLIYNGIDTNLFSPVQSENEKKRIRKRLNLCSETVTILYHGRLAKHKNLETLFKAISNLRSLDIQLSTIIIGNGPHREALKRIVNDLELKDRIEFLSFRNNVNEYLQAADIYCLPSFLEGHSLALLEAMSTGLTCIASDIEGNNEVIMDHENGYLFDPCSINQLSDLIKRVGEDKADRQRIAIASRRTVIDNFSLQNMVLRYMALYKELLRDKENIN